MKTHNAESQGLLNASMVYFHKFSIVLMQSTTPTSAVPLVKKHKEELFSNTAQARSVSRHMERELWKRPIAGHTSHI